MRPVPQSFTAFMEGHEGLSLRPYLCPANVWTIGIGSIRGLDGKRVTASTPQITIQQAHELLTRDLRLSMRSVDRLITTPLSDNAYFALVSFTYNLGGGALQVSTLRKVINRGELHRVEGEFNKWVWGGRPKRKFAGLIRRRAEEAVLFFTPDFVEISPAPEPEEFASWVHRLFGISA